MVESLPGPDECVDYLTALASSVDGADYLPADFPARLVDIQQEAVEGGWRASLALTKARFYMVPTVDCPDPTTVPMEEWTRAPMIRVPITTSVRPVWGADTDRDHTEGQGFHSVMRLQSLKGILKDGQLKWQPYVEGDDNSGCGFPAIYVRSFVKNWSTPEETLERQMKSWVTAQQHHCDAGIVVELDYKAKMSRGYNDTSRRQQVARSEVSRVYEKNNKGDMGEYYLIPQERAHILAVWFTPTFWARKEVAERDPNAPPESLRLLEDNGMGVGTVPANWRSQEAPPASSSLAPSTVDTQHVDQRGDQQSNQQRPQPAQQIDQRDDQWNNQQGNQQVQQGNQQGGQQELQPGPQAAWRLGDRVACEPYRCTQRG